ncbi:prepilin peptidase [Granulicella tundricola]|uniref:Prepilin peptidase n=1 Tax=Granulicella tundricola (strain ATCC BAA-1859 / DSM 23138 / MP5ACTX9) TaxID=1198114 RepID=E8X4M4_GRATM|nr:A24 family peptidase [Granulicella tundricola]ADW69434.1 Prepilin peptidase [Granulicella tundricola MP5ACTX9]
MLSPVFFEAAGLLLGLLFGSFLNVCISRLPQHQSVVTPRSKCPGCEHPIRWFDNIPLLSWVLLRGRCRDCKERISWRYPAVELATGLWFARAGAQIRELHYVSAFGLGPLSGSQLLEGYVQILAIAVLGFLLIGLIVMDWQTQRLPDAFTLGGIFAGLFLVCTQAIFLGPTEAQINLTSHHLRMSSPGSFVGRGNVFLTGPEHLIFGRLLAVAGIAAILLTIRALYKAVRHRDGLGLGDVKMLAMVAAFLGFWPTILTLFLGTFLASAYAIPLVLRRRANALTKLPFGSFLGIAGLLAALFAEPILNWYAGLFR